MATAEFELLGALETHDVDAIRAMLETGWDVRQPIKGKSIVTTLTEMYTRSDRFPACLRLLLERGGVLDDPRVAPVLLDDPVALGAALRASSSLITHRTSMVSAYTPLIGASMLHVAAEFGHLNAARVLIERGAVVDARAAMDDFGLNGHTPLFHTVNSHANRSAPVMELLLSAGARATIHVPGIIWGKGFEWETTCFDVTPISYAQFGLLPQMHRREADVAATVTRLLRAAGRRVPPLTNVPNQYLVKRP